MTRPRLNAIALQMRANPIFSLFIFSVVFLISCHSKMELSSPLSAHPFETEAVIGGEATSSKEFPFMVNLWLDSPSENFTGHLCGASLIDKKWVLTAAHCVVQDVTDKSLGLLKASELTLFLESEHITGKNGRPLKVKAIQVHPRFSWPRFDVALIELADPVTDVKPISLNSNKITDFSKELTAISCGWGLTDEAGKKEAELLQKITLPLVSPSLCQQDAYVVKKNWKIEADTLCAKTTLGKKATCSGDSGGPLFRLVDGHFQQIGIVSWGSACRPLYQDNQSNVEGYADVAEAFPWIQSQISQ